MVKERMVDLALSIHNLEKIMFADSTFIGFGHTPFPLRALIDLQRNTLLLNQMILRALNEKTLPNKRRK
jgi:hypothetical protein